VGTGQLLFRSHDFFPAKKANSIFPPKGQRNVGRCGEERVTGEHGCAGGEGGSSGEPAQTVDHPGMTVVVNLQPLSVVENASVAVIPTVNESRKSPEPRGVGLSIGPLMFKQMEDEVVEKIDDEVLLSAKFCERINSCANQIVTVGKTSFGDDLMDTSTVLRMNKNFM